MNRIEAARQRDCPKCKAKPGEPCRSVSGRKAQHELTQVHKERYLPKAMRPSAEALGDFYGADNPHPASAPPEPELIPTPSTNDTVDRVVLPTRLHTALIDLLKMKGLTLSDFVRMHARQFLRMPPQFKLQSKMTFGQYRDESLENVIRLKPDYIVWCMMNVPGFEIDTDAYALMKEQMPSWEVEME